MQVAETAFYLNTDTLWRDNRIFFDDEIGTMAMNQDAVIAGITDYIVMNLEIPG